jgi:hypothetical protein
MTEKPLKVYPVKNYEMGEYAYYVATPGGDYMYYKTKKEALSFIDFYKEYTNKHPDKV